MNTAYQNQFSILSYVKTNSLSANQGIYFHGGGYKDVGLRIDQENGEYKLHFFILTSTSYLSTIIFRFSKGIHVKKKHLKALKRSIEVETGILSLVIINNTTGANTCKKTKLDGASFNPLENNLPWLISPS